MSDADIHTIILDFAVGGALLVLPSLTRIVSAAGLSGLAHMGRSLAAADLWLLESIGDTRDAILMRLLMAIVAMLATILFALAAAAAVTIIYQFPGLAGNRPLIATIASGTLGATLSQILVNLRIAALLNRAFYDRENTVAGLRKRAGK